MKTRLTNYQLRDKILKNEVYDTLIEMTDLYLAKLKG